MSVNKITDLMLACKNGDVNSVKELLKKGVYVHELYNNKEEETIVDKSALTYASENGHNDIVFLLIYAGALNLRSCCHKPSQQRIWS